MPGTTLSHTRAVRVNGRRNILPENPNAKKQEKNIYFSLSFILAATPCACRVLPSLMHFTQTLSQRHQNVESSPNLHLAFASH